MISKPFSWIATPSRSSKRDHSPDIEQSTSPSADLPAKRARRRSPSPTYSQSDLYAPTPTESLGRAGEGRSLRPSNDVHPALPPTLSGARTRSSNATNLSRPLSSSQSMGYLDPPVAGLPRGLRRTPGLGRTQTRMDLAAVANGAAEEDEEMQSQTQGSLAGSPPRAQPVRSRDVSARRPQATTTADMQFGHGLPSNSPFRAATPSSPSRFGGSLSRAQTMRNIGRADSVLSDVSMASAARSQVGGSIFGTPARNRMSVDVRSNVSFTATSAVALADMKNLFAPHEQANSIFGRDNNTRAGSADTTTFPPIRRGNLVYAGDKGFVRESELRAEEPPNRGANDAEKLLFALENRRNTPLQAARSSALPFSQGGPFPHHLVGASTRQIRKEINVPLPTAHARETVRGLREKDLQEERERGVSVLISPYGRRRAADEELRAARIAEQQRRREQERKESESGASNVDLGRAQLTAVYRPSSERELSIPRSTRRTRSVSSKLSDYDMEEDVTMTPRRSARLKRGDRETSEGTTPKASRTEKGKGKVSSTPKKSGRAAATSPPETRRSARKRSADRATSPEPAPTVSAPPSVPTITETAPSPQQQSKATSILSGYQPRSADGGSREGSSLRTGREKTNRTHVGAATYTAKANTPGSGRFSALEDDLPDMDDLEESSKIPANLFSGVSFGSMAPAASTPASTASAPKTTQPAAPEQSTTSDAGSLASRLGPQPAAGGLGVPRKGHLAKFDTHKPRATSPLASAPINALPESPPQAVTPATTQSTTATAPAQSADGFFSLSTSAPESTTPAGKPPATSLFAGFGGATAPSAPPAGNLFGSIDQPKKTAGSDLGLGKPSSTSTAEKQDASAPPSFFSTTPVTPVAPAASTGFNFGVSAAAPTAAPLQGSATPSQSGASTPKAGSLFSFDTAKTAAPPATAAPAGGNVSANLIVGRTRGSADSQLFGVPKPAETAVSTAPAPATFSFGAKPAESAAKPDQSKSPFDFGSSGTSTSNKPAEAPKSLFGGIGQSASSSTPAPTEKKEEAPKPSFGGFGSSAPAKADEPKTNAFGGNFGKPAAGAAPSTGAPFGGFTGFGTATQSKEAQPVPASGSLFGTAASTSTPATGTTAPSFNFGAPASSAPTNNAAPGSFGGAGSSSSTNLFGANKKRGAGESSDEPASKFGSQPGSPTTAPAASTGFSFGSAMNGTSSSSNNASTGFGAPNSSSFSFGAPKPSTPSANPTANPFGAAATSATTTSAPSFNFGQSNNAAAPGSAPGTPTTPSAGFNFSFGATSNAPAAGAAPSAPSTPFTFGAPAPTNTSTTPSFPPANNSGFGAQNGFGQASNTSNGFGAPSSGFGASSAGFGSSSTPSAGFTFGATQSSAPAAAFGAAAPAQNGGGVFSFGAPANGAPAAGPSQAPPGSPGGFSMGAAGNAPGSPSGRVIKPLRSTRRAR